MRERQVFKTSPQYALSPCVWDEVANRLAQAHAVLVALDFDGTLAPIVDYPDKAAVPDGTLALLRSLAHKSQYRVAIITGRALGDVKPRVGIDGLIYGGNHGLEIEQDGRLWNAPGAERAGKAVQEAGAALAAALRPLPGLFLEHKGVSLSIHFRRASADEKRAGKQICRETLKPFLVQRQLKVFRGKQVLEVQPALAWDKGACLRKLVASTPDRYEGEELFMFLGDDVFDEPAFRVAHEMNGLGILVGRPRAKTAATLYLRSTSEVQTFLHCLATAATNPDRPLDVQGTNKLSQNGLWGSAEGAKPLLPGVWGCPPELTLFPLSRCAGEGDTGGEGFEIDFKPLVKPVKESETA